MGKAQILSFDYAAAADDYERISKDVRFEQDARRDAARDAVIIRSHLEAEATTLADATTLRELGASQKVLAEADSFIAKAAFEAWDRGRALGSEDPKARATAVRVLEGFYNKYQSTDDADRYVSEVSHLLFVMGNAAKDTRGAKRWCERSVRAFGAFAKNASNQAAGSSAAPGAAECAYVALDADLKSHFDLQSVQPRYKGAPTKVEKDFRADLKAVTDKWRPALESISKQYGPTRWSVLAIARNGALYDALRTQLSLTTPQFYTSAEDARHEERCVTVDSEDVEDRCRLRTAEDAWRVARFRILSDADGQAVALHVGAILGARALGVQDEAIDAAHRRLAALTDILGDDRLAALLVGVLDPGTKKPFVYRKAMFLTSLRGRYAPRPVELIATPLPAVP
jgi:hypothetical protein